jgi:DNA adenine methylase
MFPHLETSEPALALSGQRACPFEHPSASQARKGIVQDTLHVYPFCSCSPRFSPGRLHRWKTQSFPPHLRHHRGHAPHQLCRALRGHGRHLPAPRAAPRAEAINDISGDVVTLFRCLAEHYPYLIDMLRFRVASRAEFERLLAQPPERLTDLQRAVRFLYVQRLAFGGRVSGRTFGVDASSPARFDVGKLEPMLAEIHERLQSVVIERLPYAEFIRRYDRAGALFYLDPPYWACERDYGPDVFTREDFAALASQLATIKGKFLVSLNDTQGVRNLRPLPSPPSPRPTPLAPSPARPENCSSATSRSPETITEAVTHAPGNGRVESV